MIRLASGDLSAHMLGISPCGRTNLRLKGWMGRADQTAKVKGMFVHPKQIAEIAKRHPQLARLRLVIGREGEQDTMTLLAEGTTRDAALESAIAMSLRSVTNLKGVVKCTRRAPKRRQSDCR
jgi:phenylacetate-CoA ligase